MHTSIEQLIALRDKQPVEATVAAHLDACRDCRERLVAVRECQQQLRNLPLHEPSPQVLDAIRTRLEHPVTARQRAAVAATGVAAALLIVTWLAVSVQLNEATRTATVNAVGAQETTLSQVGDNAATRELIRRSQSLESVYARLSQVPVERYSASTASALEALQDRLAMLDYGLNQSRIDPGVQQHIEQLWRRRVDTLQNMVGVQYAELARQGYHSFQVLPAGYLEDESIRW